MKALEYQWQADGKDFAYRRRPYLAGRLFSQLGDSWHGRQKICTAKRCTRWLRRLQAGVFGREELMRPQPLIVVSDVEASSRWYQYLFGCQSAHGGKEYERLMSNDTLVLQLHHWEVEHDHGPLGDPHAKPYGNGVLLWFEVDDFDAAVARATELKAEIVLPPHRNPPDGNGGPNHREIWLRDLDGYTVVLASPDGEAGNL
jgi:catechol 2,3-dioxygenase-like lactoylglutathione lyase family enzyme